MLSHAAPHLPTDGRTASGDPLNGAICRFPVAKQWIGGGQKWIRDGIRQFRASRLPAAGYCQSNANLSPFRGIVSPQMGEMPMQPVSFKRHRFPPDVIRLAVWLYFRFTLSFRDVEEMLAQRGIEASYETVRCWTLKFG